MALPTTTFGVEEEGLAESQPYHNAAGDILERISHEIFRNDVLDRRLKRHHITGTLLLDNNA